MTRRASPTCGMIDTTTSPDWRAIEIGGGGVETWCPACAPKSARLWTPREGDECEWCGVRYGAPLLGNNGEPANDPDNPRVNEDDANEAARIRAEMHDDARNDDRRAGL